MTHKIADVLLNRATADGIAAGYRDVKSAVAELERRRGWAVYAITVCYLPSTTCLIPVRSRR